MTHPACQVFQVRELLYWSVEELQSLPLVHVLEFDDGEQLRAVQNYTVYSALFWRIFLPYPSVKIRKHHHVQSILKKRSLDSGTHLKLCSRILESICTEAELYLPVQKEPLLEDIYRTISDAMKVLTVVTEEYVATIDVLDIVGIVRDPELIALKAEAKRDPANKIKYVYEESIKMMETAPRFKNNNLAKSVAAKMVKNNQVVQAVVFRGFPAEVDGAIFSKAIFSNYTLGLRKLYDFVTDSRTAAKSHYYTGANLEDSEYMARKFRLFAMVLERVHYEDCQTDKLLLWHVKPAKYDAAGTVTYPGDLPFLIGKHYLLPDGKYGTIDGSEQHLVGTKIQLRSMIYCKTPNPHEVCHVCAGKLSQNISRFANLGHLGAVSVTKEITQNILSIKHVNTSSTALKILLGEIEARFFDTGPTGAAFHLKESVKSRSPVIKVARDEAPGLIDIRDMDDLDSLSLSRVSQTSTISLTIRTREDMSQEMPLSVMQKKKCSMLSREFLQFLKVKGWSMDEKNNFVFDLEGWDYAQPMFVMENKEESFADLASMVSFIVESNQKTALSRNAKDQASVQLFELFDLVNSKLRINLFSIECLITAMMVASKTDYSLPRGSDDPTLGISDMLTKYRSLGPAFSYELQHRMILSPANYFQGTRPDSPMDVFVAPKEVVEQYEAFERARLSNL